MNKYQEPFQPCGFDYPIILGSLYYLYGSCTYGYARGVSSFWHRCTWRGLFYFVSLFFISLVSLCVCTFVVDVLYEYFHQLMCWMNDSYLCWQILMCFIMSFGHIMYLDGHFVQIDELFRLRTRCVPHAGHTRSPKENINKCPNTLYVINIFYSFSCEYCNSDALLCHFCVLYVLGHQKINYCEEKDFWCVLEREITIAVL